MSNFAPLPGSATVVMVVGGQPITIALDGNNAPLTAGNFADLVSRRFYDDISFHRVVPDFVAQAGDPNSRDPNFPTNLLGREGFTDPATGATRTIPLEIKPQGATEPLLGSRFRDAGITVPPLLRNDRGTIAMARSQDPNSASSQFYFNLVNSRFLDGDYAVFGNITDGLSVMDNIGVGDRIEAARFVDGILPSRQSAFMDVNSLNFYFNRLERASLPLGFQLLTDGDDFLDITAELSQANPSGFVGLGGDDTILGSPIDDVIYGNQGNDTLTGEAGNNLIRGGQGDDVIMGGTGNDILHGNLGNDTIMAGGGNNVLRGGQGDDVLIGGPGNDVLIGDRGQDTLTGGAGADSFVFRGDTNIGRVDPNQADVVTDFNPAEGDRIVLAAATDPATVRFIPSGADVLIQLDNDDFQGRILNSTPEAVQAASMVVSPTDMALLIG
ncbi:peptidylprolyl isomerase [Sodalinema gerasimenkoae]|uniref:peptidylprolyl isomerase n=1 Tax=Sodalinema gerasimenkoae TaxID=2862348 RepID=UPI001359D0A4|nr:peptidylprolyl isomerase [Sodalinema gerasimenkoae]